jgi:hypothetical protein
MASMVAGKKKRKSRWRSAAKATGLAGAAPLCAATLSACLGNLPPELNVGLQLIVELSTVANLSRLSKSAGGGIGNLLSINS